MTQVPAAAEIAELAAEAARFLPDTCSIATRTPVKTATGGTTYTLTTRRSTVPCRAGGGVGALFLGAGQRLSVQTEDTIAFAAGTDVAVGDALIFADGNLLVTKLNTRRAWELTRIVTVKALT